MISPLQAGFLTFGSSNKTSPLFNTPRNSQNIALISAVFHENPSPSKGGGSINIVDGVAIAPDSGPLGANGDGEVKIPKSDQISIYVVREGDSLSEIAEMFDVSVNTILWANDIGRRGLIKPGQTLIILPVSGVQHVVKKGDTIAGIAKKYAVKEDEIFDFNFLEEGGLALGQTIIVPGGKIAQTVSSAGTSPRSYASSAPVYEGYYLRPIGGGVKSQGIHGYNGVDLATYSGAPIFAAAGGTVLISRTGWNGGYGNYIVIAHQNGTQTVYAHNQSNIVSAGQNVVQGQIVGYVGVTGRSTGPHLHFEVRGARNPF